jgi:hypothetical protein
VRRITALLGRPPGTVVADRGFGVAANDRALADLGVRRIGLQRTGTPSAGRRALEQTRQVVRPVEEPDAPPQRVLQPPELLLDGTVRLVFAGLVDEVPPARLYELLERPGAPR